MLELGFKSRQASSRGTVLNFRMWSGIQHSLMAPCIVTTIIFFFFFFLLLSSFETALVWGGGPWWGVSHLFEQDRSSKEMALCVLYWLWWWTLPSTLCSLGPVPGSGWWACWTRSQMWVSSYFTTLTFKGKRLPFHSMRSQPLFILSFLCPLLTFISRV